MTDKPGRDIHLDMLRGFAIACVVFGHAVQRNLPVADAKTVMTALAAFEMPLFVFLSGTVLAGRVHSPRWRWVLGRALRLLVPFVAWTVIYYYLQGVPTQGFTPYIDFSGGLTAYVQRTITDPAAGLWYLPAIFICSALLALLYPLRSSVLALALLGVVIFHDIPHLRGDLGVFGDYGVVRASEYWLFFVAGFAWADRGRSLEFRRPLWWSWLLLYPAVAATAFLWAATYPWPQILGTRLLVGLVGIAFSTVLAQLLAPVARRLGLHTLGRLTMGVYCIHFIFLRPGIAHGWAGVAIAFMVALLGSVAITLVLQRIPYVRGVLLGEWPRKVASAPS